MKQLLPLALVFLLGASAASAQTFCYSWEDGDDFLDCSNCDDMTAANVASIAYGGSYSLEIAALDASDPEAFVAWVTELRLGDIIDVSLWVRDLTESAMPAVQFRGAWTDNGDIGDVRDSASGPAVSAGSATGEWQKLSYIYTVDEAHQGEALRISIIPHGDAATWGDPCWADDLCVTIPDDALLHFPGPGPVGNVEKNWGEVKVLYK